MKKISKLGVGLLVFVALLYHQNPGVNVAIICIVVCALLLLPPHPVRRGSFWLLPFAVFASAISFAWYGDPFSFLALFVSMLVIGIQAQYPKVNILLYPVIWFLSFITFIVRIFYFKRWLPVSRMKNDFWKKVIAFGVIPALFVILFVTVYASGSEYFRSLFQNFTFSINLFQIVFLSCAGFFLLFNLWFMFIPREIIRINQWMGDDFNSQKRPLLKLPFSFLPGDFQRKSGEISLFLLNVLLLFFIITYNYEQFFSPASAATLSSEIHGRVAMIIFSILLAIAVIMFYFKSSSDFDSKARRLKILAFIWIILNALLIVSAFLKNSEYVSAFGLTYKRIGVFIFLGLSIAGLAITYWKIKHQKTNIFLLNRITWTFFVTLVVTSWINFSWIVTKYNISFHKNEDTAYLKKLEFNKQLLYDIYHNDPNWQDYFENEQEHVTYKQNEHWLSSTFYYRFIKIGAR